MRLVNAHGVQTCYSQSCVGGIIMFFFFSSRRRHTRSLCDWSSDVCSSDLTVDGFLLQVKLNYLKNNMLCLLKLLIVSNEHSLVLFVKLFIEKIIANDVRYASGLSTPNGYIKNIQKQNIHYVP